MAAGLTRPSAADGPNGIDETPAWRSLRAWTRLLAVLSVALAVDLVTKSASFRTVAGTPVVLDRGRLLADLRYDPIPPHEGAPLLPGGLLEMRLVLNPGAVFGIGANQRVFFIVFTVFAFAAGLVVFTRMTAARDRIAHVALGLVLAGGIGNLYDRVAFGRVRDFLRTLAEYRLPNGWTWPGTNNPEMFPWVFNVADVELLVGMVMLMVFLRRRRTSMQAEDVEASRHRGVETGG